MDKPTLAMITQKLHPHISEVFDGYVIVGYHTDLEGRRRRLVIADASKDAAIKDGLRPFLAHGMGWQSQDAIEDAANETEKGGGGDQS